jgi:Methyltransferase domain
MRPRTALALAGAGVVGAALWWRKNPSACPYGQRFWVQAPHPVVTRDRLREVMRPEPGERILEIGPGTGYYTLDIAEWVCPEGRVEIFDLQQEFLDHTVGRARKRGLANVVPTQGDATALPYEDGSMDAVVLTAVLGEIPDRLCARSAASSSRPDAWWSVSSSATPTSPPLPASSARPPRPASAGRPTPATGSPTSLASCPAEQRRQAAPAGRSTPGPFPIEGTLLPFNVNYPLEPPSQLRLDWNTFATFDASASPPSASASPPSPP